MLRVYCKQINEHLNKTVVWRHKAVVLICKQFRIRILMQHKGKSKVKLYPLQALMWPRGWIGVQLYSSITAALEGGEWSAARHGRTLPPGKTRYPLYRRLGGPKDRSGWRKISSHQDTDAAYVLKLTRNVYSVGTITILNLVILN